MIELRAKTGEDVRGQEVNTFADNSKTADDVCKR
jgi:hypothetical protein